MVNSSFQRPFCLGCLMALMALVRVPADVGNLGAWGDQGDGTYKNPILPGDYSDIDVIQVDSVYYAISSTFQFSPGVIILQSKDLVNWTILGHVTDSLTLIGPRLNYTIMGRSGRGIWAGSIRHYQGKFRVYFCTPDEGCFMSTAVNAAGPWDPLTRVLSDTSTNFPAAGWDDCCPFWDDNGQGYLVLSNFSNSYNIHLCKMSADGKRLLSATDSIIHQSSGSEANKLYKINGYYYHYYSETGHPSPEGRVVMMERSTNIYGPYTERKELIHSNGSDREPNQGGLVQDRVGGWWFVTHQGTGGVPDGRTACLLPVNWVNGWPIIGIDNDGDGIGEMVWGRQKPIAGCPITIPQSSDEFSSSTLQPQWEWFYQPRADKWSLSARSGFLRLSAFRPLTTGAFFTAGNTISQRYMRTDTGIACVKMDISKMVDGQEAGLCHFNGGSNYATIGIVQTAGVRSLKYNNNGTVTNGPQVSAAQIFIWLRSKMSRQANSTCEYSLDSTTFTQLGGTYALGWGNYRGDRLGMYCYNNTTESGYVDIDWFHYTFAGPTPTPVAINSQKNSNTAQSNKNISVQCIAGGDGRTIIKLPEHLRSNAQVTMYDIAGRAIPFTIEQSGMYLSVNHLSTNIVFLRIQSGRQSAVTIGAISEPGIEK